MNPKEATKYPNFMCFRCNKMIPLANATIHRDQCHLRQTANALKVPPRPNPIILPPTRPLEQPSQLTQKFPCYLCGQPQTLVELDTHPMICKNKEAQCQYCKVNFPSMILKDHLLYCPEKKEKKMVPPTIPFDTQLLPRLPTTTSYPPSSSTRSEQIGNNIKRPNRSLEKPENTLSQAPKQSGSTDNVTQWKSQALKKKQKEEELNKKKKEEELNKKKKEEEKKKEPQRLNNRPERTNERENTRSDGRPAQQGNPFVHTILDTYPIYGLNNRIAIIHGPDFDFDGDDSQSEDDLHELPGTSERRASMMASLGSAIFNEIYSHELRENHRAAIALQEILRIRNIRAQIRGLAERNNNSMNSGMKVQDIQKINDVSFGRIKSSAMNDVCSICCCDYEDNDIVKDLKCNHIFHSACISQWLLKNKSCPLCKTDTSQSINFNRWANQPSLKKGKSSEKNVKASSKEKSQDSQKTDKSDVSKRTRANIKRQAEIEKGQKQKQQQKQEKNNPPPKRQPVWSKPTLAKEPSKGKISKEKNPKSTKNNRSNSKKNNEKH